MEADDVVGEDPAVDLLADHRRQHPPRVRLAPRDVDEVRHERVGAGAADQRRQRVEVVVVDHHDRPLDPLDLIEHGPREILVDDVVAELERLGLVAADVRRVGQIPEVMLDEPQHRVGDDVVEAVVRLGVGGDELDAGTRCRPVSRTGKARPPWRAGHRDVAVGHRRGDPGDLAVRARGPSARSRARRCRAAPRRRAGRSPDRGWRRGSGAQAYAHHRAIACRRSMPASISSHELLRAAPELAAEIDDIWKS